MKYNIIKEKTVCLTGHRPKSLPWGYDESEPSCKEFKENLKQIFIGAIKFRYNTFLTGMAEGFDMIATEILLQLKEKYDIKVVAVVPCLGQEVKWKREQQIRYKSILKKCDEVIVLSDKYTSTCMNDRNKFMVQHSSCCIACWDGRPSGTGNTVRLAIDNGVFVREINPVHYALTIR